MFRQKALLLSFGSTALSHCTRPQLAEAVDVYLATQTSSQPSVFKIRFDNSTWLGYFENGQKFNIDTNILNKPLTITHSRSIYDTTSCATYSELVVNTTMEPYVISTQLRYANHKINKIDSAITQSGNWGIVPEEKRDTLETSKKVADAHCDIFNSPNVTMPWGTPCVRLEGGFYGDPGPNGSYAVGAPSGVSLHNRRYVIDEIVGSVEVMLDFGKSRWPDSHEFRIEEGKIRYVHTMTHCGI